MKRLGAPLVLLLASCSALPAGPAQPASSSGYANRLTVLLGQRALDETDYEPVENQATVGFEYAYEVPGSALGFEAGLMGSYDDGNFLGLDVEGRTSEIFGGLRKTFGEGVAHPYVGAGLTLIQSEVEVVGVGEADDSSPGLYVHGGVLFEVTPSFFLGLDGRFVFGTDLTIAGFDTDADYGQLAFTLGFSF